ncbi:MAG: M15 family metallopeptidase [Treponema sp.]|nr:M15 family metallopeptidase [Treponema sp.]
MKKLILVCTLAGILLASGFAAGSVFSDWKAGTPVTAEEIAAYGEAKCFAAEEISNKIFARMQKKSFREDCTVPRTDLRYIRTLHYDTDGTIYLGEMVCNKAIATDLIEIFRELYKNKYPIQRMVLIDDYNASEEEAMRDNNSFCFCFGTVANTKVPSAHAKGLSVDINPLYNPYFNDMGDGLRLVEPPTGEPYLDRKKNFPYKIVKNDLCYKLFIAHGFEWAGERTKRTDYKHFEKKLKSR